MKRLAHYKMETTPRESKQIDLWISEFVTFGAATVFIGLRLLSRRLTRVEFWWDDWFAIGCYVSLRLYLTLTLRIILTCTSV